MEIFIGVDIGTTHAKAICCTAEGEILFACKRDYPESKKTSFGEMFPEEIAEKVFDVLKEAFQFSYKKGDPVFVSFSCMMHGMMAVDDTGKPITPLYTWADNRSKAEAEELKISDSGRRLYEKTGVPVHPMSPLCKLMWLRKNAPEIFRQASKFISIKEYIFYKLFGKYIIDHSIASATGLFNIYEKRWDDEALNLAGIDAEKLSVPVSAFHAESELTDPGKKMFGVEKNLPFYVGASDGCLANLGVGAIQPGEAALTIGTSGAIRQTVQHIKVDVHQRLFNYILADDYFVNGGAVNNGGISLQWWVEKVLDKKFEKGDEFNSFIAGVKNIPAGCNGMVCLPYFLGERSPVWDAAAKGCFVNVRMEHSTLDFTRAIMEGICFSFKQIMQAMEEQGHEIEVVYASGGFINSQAWLQMMADILFKPIKVIVHADASAMGAVFLGMKASRRLNDLYEVKDIIKSVESYLPDRAVQKVYDKNFSVFETLYTKLSK